MTWTKPALMKCVHVCSPPQSCGVCVWGLFFFGSGVIHLTNLILNRQMKLLKPCLDMWPKSYTIFSCIFIPPVLYLHFINVCAGSSVWREHASCQVWCSWCHSACWCHTSWRWTNYPHCKKSPLCCCHHCCAQANGAHLLGGDPGKRRITCQEIASNSSADVRLHNNYKNLTQEDGGPLQWHVGEGWGILNALKKKFSLIEYFSDFLVFRCWGFLNLPMSGCRLRWGLFHVFERGGGIYMDFI